MGSGEKCFRIRDCTCTGSLWVIGWMFTIGYLHLPFLKALLAIIVWPYFVGSALRMPGL